MATTKVWLVWLPFWTFENTTIYYTWLRETSRTLIFITLGLEQARQQRYNLSQLASKRLETNTSQTTWPRKGLKIHVFTTLGLEKARTRRCLPHLASNKRTFHYWLFLATKTLDNTIIYHIRLWKGSTILVFTQLGPEKPRKYCCSHHLA